MARLRCFCCKKFRCTSADDSVPSNPTAQPLGNVSRCDRLGHWRLSAQRSLYYYRVMQVLHSRGLGSCRWRGPLLDVTWLSEDAGCCMCRFRIACRLMRPSWAATPGMFSAWRRSGSAPGSCSLSLAAKLGCDAGSDMDRENFEKAEAEPPPARERFSGVTILGATCLFSLALCVTLH